MCLQKKCFRCHQELSLNDFYAHPQMADGHLNKCKECAKKDISKNRNKNIKYYRKYDRERGSRQTKESRRKYREKYPNKCKAHWIVNNSIRDGKLFREPCEHKTKKFKEIFLMILCGKKNTHAHHDDYLKPLNIRWLCPEHHSEWHKENEAVNK